MLCYIVYLAELGPAVYCFPTNNVLLAQLSVSSDNLYPSRCIIPFFYHISQLQQKAKPIPICCFCLGDEKKNRNNVPEDMVSCCRCGQSGGCISVEASHLVI